MDLMAKIMGAGFGSLVAVQFNCGPDMAFGVFMGFAGLAVSQAFGLLRPAS